MDKNTIAGFGLLMLLLVGYIVYNDNSEKKYRAQQTKDSIAEAKLHPKQIALIDTSKIDSSKINASIPDTNLPVIIKEEETVIENAELAITFTNKGGYPKQVLLKKFKTFDGKPLMLFKGDKNAVDFGFKSTQGNLVHSKSQVFSSTKSSDGKSIVYTNNDIRIEYTLPISGYMVKMNATPLTADKSQNISLQWKASSLLTEHDIESQKMYTQVCYNLEDEGYDYFTIKEKESKELKDKVKWISFKQHYFNATLIPENKLASNAKITSQIDLDTNTKSLSDFSVNLDLAPQQTMNFDWFLGPNNYSLLKSYNKDLQEIIPLSYAIFGFVKYINTWLIIPIFNALAKVFSSYGIVILLLTFIIRLLMSPFTYKSYVSSAKMKALKPDMDELREKLGDDKQAFGVEQMKLYRQAGVNPLGGCLPALLQLPVFFALLSFFPHAIELRQENFLWAHDLSTYDSILNLPFTIPFYGNHVSLFTILFVITSLLLSLYSMNSMAGQGQDNPMMKYLPFIMPVMFLGIFNKLPAALTYYYFVSNVITLALQFVIQNYIIDSKKIHEQIQAKKNEPMKENKLMARMAEMQKQQQERLKGKK
ncbi:MAG: membrane protein insertase YidC [Bacteroidetes bacterium]|nr:membrane protein insertase YidC [Bacteroidota bacterium]